MTSERSEDLKAFLDSVLISQGDGDPHWRSMGRWMGLYFLGVLGTGAEPDVALHMTEACQAEIFRQNRPQLSE